MAYVAALGALIGAGGQIAGSQTAASAGNAPPIGSQISVGSDPRRDPTLSAATFDALNLIGRGDPFAIASPLDSLIERINGLANADNKLKRRALSAIAAIRSSGARGINDPNFLRLREPQIESNRTTTSNVPYHRELQGIMNRLGINEEELFGTIRRDAEFKLKQTQDASDQGRFNSRIQRERMDTASAASQLLGEAGRFATSGQTQNDFQNGLLGRINRGINEQEAQFLLRANFGGFQPGIGLRNFQQARTDAPMTAFEQALAAAGGLTAGLGGGLEFAQPAAAQNVGGAFGGSSIAAQQAIAANAIRGQGNSDLGNGIASGLGSIGTALSNQGFINQLNDTRDKRTTTTTDTASNGSFDSRSIE